MAAVLVELLPMILGAVLAPLWIIIVLLMLSGSRGLAKATAFVLGMSLTRLAQGVIFGTLMGASAAANPEDGTQSPVVSTLLLVVGILLLIAAFRKWRKEDDPDEPPPKWIQSIDELSPLRALGLGALMVAIGPKLWVFTLSAIATIVDADPGRQLGIVAYLAYIILAQSVLIVAILVAAVAPRASKSLLQRAVDWLNTYNRPISVTVALIFGVLFTWDGIQGLLG